MTYTYAILQVSQAVYDEIRSELTAAGYDQEVLGDKLGPILDMHGIALQVKAPDE